jgi:GT2 family glycosyltransferase
LSDNLSMFHEFDAAAPPGPRPYLPTLNLSVRREAFEAAGPMDPRLPRGEDLEWTIRLASKGHRPYFEPAARIWHRPARATVRAMWAHWHASGRWLVGVRGRHPEVFGPPTWLYRPIALRLLSPFIAAWITGRLYRPGAPGWRHPATLPAVFATKVAWCWGAAQPASIVEGPAGG